MATVKGPVKSQGAVADKTIPGQDKPRHPIQQKTNKPNKTKDLALSVR
ncbi:MAG TPA: hypothetical protein PKY77_19300 [Phycisphaerae bacterium]|nr:hypothetical protein [Phycisphaerae bacterium]HRY70974.1 hypothetical protein [Phycisphaerae bacterium]HSA29280.1 hypothetical protein [Phycisphaerae bacterium]